MRTRLRDRSCLVVVDPWGRPGRDETVGGEFQGAAFPLLPFSPSLFETVCGRLERFGISRFHCDFSLLDFILPQANATSRQYYDLRSGKSKKVEREDEEEGGKME